MYNYKKIKILLLVITLSVFVNACLVTRISRPEITGYVFDADTKQPVSGCMVGDTFTDDDGYYKLKEIRYREFTWIGMEAPPLFVHENICKEGYECSSIEVKKLFGGGAIGARWEWEPVYLKKKEAAQDNSTE